MILRKNDYYCQLSDTLNDPETRSKAYWSILKTPYNGKNEYPINPSDFSL